MGRKGGGRVSRDGGRATYGNKCFNGDIMSTRERDGARDDGWRDTV